jgi:hypothetical protein
MKKKFRYYDPFNDVYTFSDKFEYLAGFFAEYQLSVDGGNSSILEQWTGLHDTTTWQEITEKQRGDWTLRGNFPSEWKGVHIYENDVIESEENNRHVISYDDHDACFTAEFIPRREFVTGCSIKQSWINEFKKKVVGNSNQHTELVKP